MNQTMNRDKMVEIFRAVGLDDAAMRKLHEEFERRYPAQHQSFLEWLQFSPQDIATIRNRSKSA